MARAGEGRGSLPMSVNRESASACARWAPRRHEVWLGNVVGMGAFDAAGAVGVYGGDMRRVRAGWEGHVVCVRAPWDGMLCLGRALPTPTPLRAVKFGDRHIIRR